MLKLINTKILLSILAALVAIGSAAIYQSHEAHKAAEAAAAILQQQQHDADEQRKRDEAFRKQVEQDRKRHNSAAANEGKTWKTYIP
jgi:type II secretory pathway pseudopilin PulG